MMDFEREMLVMNSGGMETFRFKWGILNFYRCNPDLNRSKLDCSREIEEIK